MTRRPSIAIAVAALALAIPRSSTDRIAITDRGKTIAVWGEGFSWTGPGGVWFNRQT
jgi:hypothetical protein